MRTIKFRAWDKKNLVMRIVSAIFFNMDGENTGVHCQPLPGFSAAVVRSPFIEGKDIELMQFTGLHDKNGKEIYEGDIVQLNCGSDDGATIRHKILALIEWELYGFVAKIPDKKVIVKGGSMEGKKLSWREIHTWVGMHDCLSDNGVKRKIIGNIYENSELLK